MPAYIGGRFPDEVFVICRRPDVSNLMRIEAMIDQLA
jgi:hypothetical protein